MDRDFTITNRSEFLKVFKPGVCAVRHYKGGRGYVFLKLNFTGPRERIYASTISTIVLTGMNKVGNSSYDNFTCQLYPRDMDSFDDIKYSRDRGYDISFTTQPGYKYLHLSRIFVDFPNGLLFASANDMFTFKHCQPLYLNIYPELSHVTYKFST